MYHQEPFSPDNLRYLQQPGTETDPLGFDQLEEAPQPESLDTPQDENQSVEDFYENLADKIPEQDLGALAGRLLENIREDKESRKDWEIKGERVMKFLGTKVEEAREVPFMRACSAYDSTLSAALMQFWASARAELFPADGPTKSKVLGEVTPQKEQEAEVIKKFLNYYLTQIDGPYYKDSDQLILYAAFFGCAFRKVYQDNILNRPIARLVKPQDLIINNNTVSFLESDRITQQMQLNRKDIMVLQSKGIYRKVDLPSINDELTDDPGTLRKSIKNTEGIDTEGAENKSLFTFYEVHTDITLDSIQEEDNKDEIPLPYIITICEVNKKIVSIRRNWKEGDTSFVKRQYFVHYQYLPGFGIYSLGMAHLAGSNAMLLTAIERLLVDAGTMKTFPGGIRSAGYRMKNNDKAVGPGSFVEVETGGMPINQAVMALPYAEPSAVLQSLRQEIIKEMKEGLLAAQMPVAEGRQDIPVGTMLAMIEVQGRLISSILRSMHASLGEELKLLFDLFSEHMEDKPFPFSVPGEQVVLLKQYFNPQIQVVPVSDPDVITSTHRLLRSEAQVKMATSAPEIHNIKEAYRRMYSDMGIQDIDKILPPDPEPLSTDPVSENMMLALGKPIKVSLTQDHDAHNIVHKNGIHDPLLQQNPQAVSQLLLHSQIHSACKLYLMMQNQGYQLPQVQSEEQILQIPEIQNALAIQDAKAIIQRQQQQQQQQEAAAASAIPDNQIPLMDIEQRREAAHLKHDEAKLKAETESFKAQLNFEGERAKTEAQENMAVEKHQVDLAMAQMKQPREVY